MENTLIRVLSVGDPNVPFCFGCNNDGDFLGCRTCQRSYHAACLTDCASAEEASKDVFHFYICIARGGNVQPSPEILRLTPASSHETSPVAADPPEVSTADIPLWMEQLQAAQDSVETGKEPSPMPSAIRRDDILEKGNLVAINNVPASSVDTQRAGGVMSMSRVQPTNTRPSTLVETYDLHPPAVASSTELASNSVRAKVGHRSRGFKQ